MHIRSRKYARKYHERYDHGPEIPIGKIDPCFILQNPSRASLSDSHVQSETWETQDPDVLYWNPVIEGPDRKAKLVWATIECTYALPDVRVHPIPFWSRKTNFKISESLKVYVSSGGLNLSASETGS
jgi:hypothetical protein